MKKLITYTLLISTLSLTAQDLHTRNNGASQNSVIIVRSDNASGDQNQSQTSDLDFQVWDSNTRLDIPQGRIGMVGEGTSSQAKEASGRMAFYTTNASYPSPTLFERMRITETGNIGIGTTSPNSILQIGANANTTSLFKADGVSSDVSFNGKHTDGNIWSFINSGTGVGTRFYVEDANNSSSRLTFDFKGNSGATNILSGTSNGYVGIGTTTPSHELTIEGASSPNIELKNSNYSNGGFVINRTNYGNQWKWWSESSAMYFGFSTDEVNYSNKLAIKTNGNIGIGTATPDMKLTVKGNIHAEEVKIDLSVPAPDYVFKDDYNLRSIEDVEKFIKVNSHLPEIPSAKEFEQNGVMQAEMDMNLLKKIEELTLYTIQQEKKIKKLENLNQNIIKQEKEIKELKGIVEQLIKSQK